MTDLSSLHAAVAPVRHVPWPPASRASAQPADLRKRNLSALIRAVVATGSPARAELAALTGLAPGTVTKLTSALAEVGLIRELDVAVSERMPGRPRIPVAIDTRRFRVAGMHIGYLRTTVCLVDLTGKLIGEVRTKHRNLKFETVISEAVQGFVELTTRHPGAVLGIGVSTGGWVDSDAGVGIEQPVLGWRNVPISRALRDRLGVAVRVESNVRALALAESWLGAGQNVRSLIHLFVGNVVGAGFVLDGQVYRGAMSSAGMLDHLPTGGHARSVCTCGRRDCLQMTASDVALVDRARARGILTENGTADDLIAMARNGSRQADRLLEVRAEQVGYAAATLIELLDPEMVVVGGGVVDAEEYLPAVRRGASDRIAAVRPFDVARQIVTSSFGPHAISVSAAAVLLAELFQDPTEFVPELNDVRYG